MPTVRAKTVKFKEKKPGKPSIRARSVGVVGATKRTGLGLSGAYVLVRAPKSARVKSGTSRRSRRKARRGLGNASEQRRDAEGKFR